MPLSAARIPHRVLSPLFSGLCLWLVTLALSGCGDMSGTYAGEGGNKIEFEGDAAYVTIYPAPAMQAEYEVDADKVIIRASGDAIVLTRRGDTLEGGPFGMKFVRQ